MKRNKYTGKTLEEIQTDVKASKSLFTFWEWNKKIGIAIEKLSNRGMKDDEIYNVLQEGC